MPTKRFSAEQIVALLHQIEVATAQGKSISIACREAGIASMNQRLTGLAPTNVHKRTANVGARSFRPYLHASIS